MKAAQLGNSDDLSQLRHFSRKRALLAQAQVRSQFVVIAEIRRQSPLEMASVQDDVVVQTLPSNRADESLGVWILPRTVRCRQNLLDTQRLDSQPNLSTVPAVAIAEEITGRFAVCECLYDLLGGPSPGRMLRHIKVQHLATIMFQDNEYEQYLHRDSRHRKEISGYHLADVVVQEGPPGLVRRAAEPAQETGDSALGDHDAKHFEFAVNPGRAPQRIGGNHPLD